MVKTIYFHPIMEKFLKGKRIKTLYIKRIRDQFLFELKSKRLTKDINDLIARRVNTMSNAEGWAFYQAFLFTGTTEESTYWLELASEYKKFYSEEMKKQAEGGNDD